MELLAVAKARHPNCQKSRYRPGQLCLAGAIVDFLVDTKVDPHGLPIAKNVVTFNGRTYDFVAARTNSLSPAKEVLSLIIEEPGESELGSDRRVLTEVFVVPIDHSRKSQALRKFIRKLADKKARPLPWYILASGQD